MLAEHTNLTVLADKGYNSTAVAQALREQNQVNLIALRRTNQQQPLPEALTHLINQVRQLIETVNRQLAEQLNIERNRAHTFYGLIARLLTKLTAHTLCTYINRLLSKADILQIKQSAFPNI